MGNEASYAADEFGPVPEGLLFLIPSKDRVLLVTKSSLEVRDHSNSIETRVVSLEPSCACATSSGNFIIGFKNGTVSEFDSELRLIHTFCLPGACHAHQGEVIGVASAYVKEPLVFTAGADKSWRVWSATQGLITTQTFTAVPVATCASVRFTWAADKFNRMHVIDLSDMSSSIFALPGTVINMSPLPGVNTGVVAVMEDGAVCIFSQNDVIAQFPPCNARCVSVLSTNADDGTVTFVVGDGEKVRLHLLEHVTAEVGTGIAQFTLFNNKILAVSGDRILKMNVGNIMKRAKTVQDMELPRKTIAEFLSNS